MEILNLKFIRIVMIICPLLLMGCASTTIDGDVYDPLEVSNRHIHEFNEGFYWLILDPAAKGFQKLPSPVQTGTHNFFSNLDDVVVIFNDALQLNLEHFTSDTLRFSFNTVLGVFGLVDIATSMGLPKHKKGFADTLGHWGIASGPYIVLPFLGPSSLRDAPALVVDSMVHPIGMVSPGSTAIALSSVRAVKARSDFLKTFPPKKIILEPYIFMRQTYYQWRQNRIDNDEEPRRLILDPDENF